MADVTFEAEIEGDSDGEVDTFGVGASESVTRGGEVERMGA
jgi:hypothetical protein